MANFRDRYNEYRYRHGRWVAFTLAANQWAFYGTAAVVGGTIGWFLGGP